MTRHKEQEKEPDCLKSYTMEEVALHTALHDRWLVVDNLVYDVSKWQFKHPGGARIIGHFAGQDATVSPMLSSTKSSNNPFLFNN